MSARRKDLRHCDLSWYMVACKAESLCTVIAEIFVCDLISYISYFLLKVRNLVAHENHAHIQMYVTPLSLYEN